MVSSRNTTRSPVRGIPRWLLVVLACAAATACSQPGGTKSGTGGPVAGFLEPTDPALGNGEYADSYPLAVTVGDRITVDLTSRSFDPYLILISPSGRWIENDDHEGSTVHSRLEVIADESGDWVVYATSLDAGEVGAYEVEIATAPSDLPGQRFERGTLQPGDEELEGGELADRITVSGKQGDYLWIDLHSRDFDPYLILLHEGSEALENDDFEGSLDRSVLGATLPQDGDYQVVVTSASAGETGAWDLTIRSDLKAEAVQRTEEGELSAGDESLREGELVDEYRIDAVPGQRVRLRLSSDDFDTYLVFIDPLGQHLENDDDALGNSSLQARIQEPGSHRILVTSYAPAETGRYSLSIDLNEVQPPAEPSEIALDSDHSGRLELGDDELPDGSLYDSYAFRAEAGTPVEILMSSAALDTYLTLLFPDGTVLNNDDDWDQTGRSRLELTLPQTGVYTLQASSYGAREEGDYRLELRRDESPVAPPVRGAPNRIFALLVGIGDYGDRMSGLENTMEDARDLRRVLLERTSMEAQDGILLVDAEATAERFRRSLGELASRMTPADELVLFYSGHGGRIRRDSFQPADPDSVDETLSLYDRELSDDELATLLDAVPGRILVVLDSCFSGGFAKDVISAPGRMGLFSSEEDVTSAVAEKFRAGGFLAAFLNQALSGRGADDGDGELTTIELSNYLHERYRSDVKGGGPEDYVRTDGPLIGYQRLVVDRGSLSPFDVLFRLRGARGDG